MKICQVAQQLGMWIFVYYNSVLCIGWPEQLSKFRLIKAAFTRAIFV